MSGTTLNGWQGFSKLVSGLGCWQGNSRQGLISLTGGNKIVDKVFSKIGGGQNCLQGNSRLVVN